MREQGIDPQLEKLADAILKEGAKKRISPRTGQPYIRPNGRGFTEFAVDHGIVTKKHDEKYHKTEMTGLDIEHVERHVGVRHSKRYDEPDDSMER